MSWTGRQLTQLTKDDTTIVYKYDSDGLRTSKTINGQEHRYWYQDGRLIYEERDDGRQFYYSYDGYGNLVYIRYYYNGKSYAYYVQTNARGDIEAMYGGDGIVRVRYIYDSWGNTLSVQDANGKKITDPNHMGNLNPMRYRGYYFDTETGLYYLHSRYYDPKTCRFVNGDGYVSTGQGLLSHNMFAYCLNNPVNKVDPNGDAAIEAAIIAAGLAVSLISALDMGISASMSGQNFWAGFGAGFIGGAVGYIIMWKLVPVLGPWASVVGRGAGTAVTGLSNELLQYGNLNNMNWGAYGADIIMDMTFSMIYCALPPIPGAAVDAVVDVGQTYLYYTPQAQENIRNGYQHNTNKSKVPSKPNTSSTRGAGGRFGVSFSIY